MMQRTILIAIIAVILIAIVAGVYFFMISSNPAGPQGDQTAGQKQGSTFDIQGMKVEVLRTGTGATSKEGDSVTVNYVGTFQDGKEFDSSVKRNAPFTFTLKEGRVIKGWALGVMGMKVGEKRKLTIPPALAYGSTGFATIPPNSTLIFEVELLKINPPVATPKPAPTPIKK